jgi:hypothetical protein
MEVLIAIFVMAIGMLALLVLFPVGALTMARAVRDDRAANAGSVASNLAVIWDVRNDLQVVNAFTANAPTNTLVVPPNPPQVIEEAASALVYVDPYYFVIGSNNLGGVITRTGVSYGPGGIATALRWFTLHDDLKFGNNGQPQTANTVERHGHYTWAYMLRRPKYGVRNVVDLSVVVYAGRSTTVQDGEFTLTGVAGAKGGYEITIPGVDHPIRQGTWLLDTTVETRTITIPGTPPIQRAYNWMHGHFYRVVNVKDDGTQTVVEVQQPLRETVTSLIVMENVIEVFEKGTDWKP